MLDLRHNLIYERTDDASVLSDFYCGINEMDDFIHLRLQARLDRKDGVQFYVVKKDDAIVALTAIRENTIELHIERGEVFSVDVLEIEYLAVKNSMQRKHIGKQIVEWIESDAIKDFPAAKFISVRAFCDKDIDYSAVPFYTSCGFRVIQKPHPMANNVKMAKKTTVPPVLRR